MILGPDGRETNGNGVASLTERQMKREMARNATISDVNEIAHKHAQNALNHLGNQIPAFVQKLVSEAIRGYHDALTIMLKEQHGIELKLPEPPPAVERVEVPEMAPEEIKEALRTIEPSGVETIRREPDLPSQESGA